MARARPAHTLASNQLTLDDWAEMLNASRAAHERPRPAPASSNGHGPVGRARIGDGASGTSTEAAAEKAARPHPVARELLETPGSLLNRTHLRELGLERRAVDAVFRALPVVALPGYSRPMIRADQYLELVERSTYRDDRVRPMAQAMDAHG
jgi:hypothetical protein